MTYTTEQRNAQQPRRFNHTDVGCYGDGGFGHDHVRACLRANLLDAFRHTEYDIAATAEALFKPMSDDAWEEYEAIEALNELACDGVYFTLCDGDLILVLEGTDCE